MTSVGISSELRSQTFWNLFLLHLKFLGIPERIALTTQNGDMALQELKAVHVMLESAMFQKLGRISQRETF